MHIVPELFSAPCAMSTIRCILFDANGQCWSKDRDIEYSKVRLRAGDHTGLSIPLQASSLLPRDRRILDLRTRTATLPQY
jgi:hypothetical protein